MSRQILNEFRILFANNTEKTVMAPTLKDAAVQNETVTLPLAQISRARVGIEVEIPDPVINVRFEAVVYPESAASGGCVATPGLYTVAEHTPVIFTAIPADGFNFTGWYKTTQRVSTDPIAMINVIAPPPDAEVSVYEARFSPVT
jgi:hypothetical protein